MQCDVETYEISRLGDMPEGHVVSLSGELYLVPVLSGAKSTEIDYYSGNTIVVNMFRHMVLQLESDEQVIDLGPADDFVIRRKEPSNG